MEQEISHPLTNEAQVIETEAAPVTPADIAIPDAPAQAVPPCAAAAPQAVPAPKDQAVVIIVQQMLPKFPNIDPNIIYSLTEELMKSQAPAPAQIVDMAPAILAGRYSMKEIVESGLGFDYAEFKADMNRLYAPKPEPLALIAAQNTMRNKYGLDIKISDAILADDVETYWRTKLAAAVEKIEKNRIEVGDEVIITAANRHFGKIGTLMTLTNEEATVLVDNVANNPLQVGAPFINLRLPTGTEKKAMLRLAAAQPLTTAWYKAVGSAVYGKLHGLEPVTLHKVAHAAVACVHAQYTGDINADVNTDNLVAVYGRIADITKIAAIRVEATAGQSDYNTRTVVADLLDEMVYDRSIEDIAVRYGGDTGYYIIVTYDKPDRVANYQAKLRRVVTTYLSNSQFRDYVLGSTFEPNKISILTDVRTVPAAYSVNQDTGLVCLPLDPMKLSGFEPKQATIQQLSEAYGLSLQA